MSSTIENVQKILEATVNAGVDLSISTPYTRIFTNGGVLVDFGAEEVTIEMFKGNRKASELVSRIVKGHDADSNVIRPGASGANDYLFALASQDLELPAGTLNKRVPNEEPYVVGMDRTGIKQFRRQWHMMKMAIDAVRRILTRNEILAKQAYFDSEMNIGDTFQGQTKLVFPRSASLKNRTVAVSWATAASATPWKDMGDAQREIKSKSQVDGSNTWFSTLPGSVMENLRAIYRSQRPNEGPGVNEAYGTYNFNPEQGVPAEFRFLVESGMEYNGWMRTSYSNSRVHLFTLPEGYDSTADDSAETYIDWLAGETITVGLYNPMYFKAYYGPGVLEPPQNNIVENAIGRVGVPRLGDLSGLTIGTSGIPANSALLNIYPLGRNQGFGATIEHAPIYAPVRPDVTCTIDTETTA